MKTLYTPAPPFKYANMPIHFAKVDIAMPQYIVASNAIKCTRECVCLTQVDRHVR